METRNGLMSFSFSGQTLARHAAELQQEVHYEQIRSNFKFNSSAPDKVSKATSDVHVVSMDVKSLTKLL